MLSTNGLPPRMDQRWIMVMDIDRCIGCFNCSVGCKTYWDVPLGKYRTRLLPGPYQGTYPTAKKRYLSLMCNQCHQPKCMEVCPTNALYGNQQGIILVDQEKCCCCNSCIEVCQYGAIYINPETKKAEKCDLCLERVQDKKSPLCVELCSGKAKTLLLVEDLKKAIVGKSIVWEEAGVVYVSLEKKYPMKWEKINEV